MRIFMALLAGALVSLAGCGGGGGGDGGTPSAPQPPSAPTGVFVVAGNGQNTISWSLASGAVSGASSYNIYWLTTPGVARSNGNRIANATSPYSHTGLSNGIAYYYVVTALNSAGESTESVQVSATPIPMGWTTVAPLPIGRSGMASAVVSGILYIAGGAEHNVGATSAVRAYDPAADAWTTRTSMPTSRVYAGAGVINGRIYVVGGCIGSDCLIGTTNILEIYDPVTNSWTTGASMPTARYGVAAGVIGGKLYIAGGSIACPPCSFQTTVEVYDPATNTWSTAQPLQSGRNHPGGAVVSGLFYVISGGQGGILLNSVEVYDPATNSWTARAGIPTARRGAAAEVINGVVYMAGGVTSSGYLPTLEAYDPVLNSWSTRPGMPTARAQMGAGVLYGRMYTVGGDNGFSISPVEVFTP